MRLSTRSRILFSMTAGLLMVQSVGAEGLRDTLWFGGRSPTTGLAVEGGVWDFEDCTPQGWTSFDLKAQPCFFTHVTADSHVVHGDPATCVITAGGSEGSIWCGAHQDYAEVNCWPGGQGYSDNWHQTLRKDFAYGGTGTVALAFDYFTDCETDFDFAFVYVVDDLGVRSPPLGTYTGSLQDGENLGTPAEPVHDSIIIDQMWLPDEPGARFLIEFVFISDPHVSDGSPSVVDYLDTVFGAFGVDNVGLTGIGLADLSDFEPTGIPGEEYDGWAPWAPQENALMSVASLDDLCPPPPSCQLEGCVMLAADTTAGAVFHPPFQHEALVSNVIPVADLGALDRTLIRFDAWEHTANFIGVRLAMHYCPWTCPETGAVDWTLHPAGDGGFLIISSPDCRTFVVDNTQYLPDLAAVDSLRLVLELLLFEEQPFQHPTPYFDNLRVGFLEGTTGAEAEPPATPRVTGLSEIVPNPFNPAAVIRYDRAEGSHVRLQVFDLGGRLVRTLADETRGPGSYVIAWDGLADTGEPVGSGAYWVRMTTSVGFSETRRAVMLK